MVQRPSHQQRPEGPLIPLSPLGAVEREQIVADPVGDSCVLVHRPLDVKTEILFTAVVYIGAYVLFLFMMARYLRGLSPVPTLVVGAIWFSLADVANALDGTQIYWLISVFFLVVTLAALLLPQKHQTAWLVVAAVFAVAASFTALPASSCGRSGCYVSPGLHLGPGERSTSAFRGLEPQL